MVRFTVFGEQRTWKDLSIWIHLLDGVDRANLNFFTFEFVLEYFGMVTAEQIMQSCSFALLIVFFSLNFTTLKFLNVFFSTLMHVRRFGLADVLRLFFVASCD